MAKEVKFDFVLLFNVLLVPAMDKSRPNAKYLEKLNLDVNAAPPP